MECKEWKRILGSDIKRLEKSSPQRLVRNEQNSLDKENSIKAVGKGVRTGDLGCLRVPGKTSVSHSAPLWTFGTGQFFVVGMSWALLMFSSTPVRC